jgi:deoxyribodipyrimidine photo-lyase
MKTAIVWFKTDLRITDLRITDNETLLKAISQNESVIPVYCFDESHFETAEYGFKKTGNFRAQFLIESLIDLDATLRALGSGLLIVKGKPEIELPKIVKQYKASKVYAKREVTFEEKDTETLVQSELWKIKCEFLTLSTSTLYHAEDLPFTIKDIPDVFTTFRKKTEKDAIIREAFEKPTTINSPQIPDF